MQHTLIAVFDNRNDAEQAMNELLSSGYSRSEVKLSQSDASGSTGSLADTDGTGSITRRDQGIGASIGNWFRDIFGSDTDEHSQKYSEAVTRGHHVLTVDTANEPEVERAADIVERYGPVDIDEKAAQWSGGAGIGRPESLRVGEAGNLQQSGSQSQQYSSGSASASGASLQGSSLEDSVLSQQGSQQRAPGTSTAIPVVEEQLKVGKREVQRGGVRVFSRVVETPVSESIGLREEHVNVERHQVDQPVSSTDSAAFKEQEITLRETAEEPVIEKTARVVEEVVVGKQVTERQEQISDTVRHTEVEVEQLAAGDDAYYRQHWQSNYGASGGSYEDYAPAYQYGSQMARSGNYRGRPWNDVENDLRSGWDARNTSGGPSTWEKFKSAVQHGWDRMTS